MKIDINPHDIRDIAIVASVLLTDNARKADTAATFAPNKIIADNHRCAAAECRRLIKVCEKLRKVKI
jgi:hypothetical protein